MEGRKETATKEVEGWKAGANPKVLGPRLPTQGRCDEDSRVTDVSRVGSSALSSSLAQSGNCVWASQAGKGAPTSLWQIRFQGSSLANLSPVLKQRSRPGETEPGHPPYPIRRRPTLGMRSAGSLKAVMVPAAHS